jgi:glycosyltransferase involved in cell wall biosynthesis
MSGLTLHHVTANIDEPGGPRYTVPALCQSLAVLGHRVHLHVLEPCPPVVLHPAELHVYPRSTLLARLGASPRMKVALYAAAQSGDVLHSHSLWLMPNVYPAGALRNTRCRLVVSPRGTLAPGAMRRHRWRKRSAWYLWQRRNLDRATCLHATATSEYEDLRNLGLTAPVMIVPNGVAIPHLTDRVAAPDGRRRLLYLGRMVREKGVERLLRAWCNVQDGFPHWELRIVGPDTHGYLAELRRLAGEWRAERAEFAGYVPEENKSAEYRSADLYVQPTHHENWGVTIAEALAHELPVLVSRGAPWREIETHVCGWWIENSVDSLTSGLRLALGLAPESLHEMGRRGRAWVASAFPWSRVAEQMQEGYRWIVDGGTAPSFVRLD